MAALLMALPCDHPDIEDFLSVKDNIASLRSANLSVILTDEFMEAVRNDEEYELKFDVEATGEKIRRKIKAKDFFMKLAEKAHEMAEPGVIYIDSVRRNNMLSGYPAYEYTIDCANPCAEFFGSEHSPCNLGSINLYNFVNNPFSENPSFDYDRLREATVMGIRVLNEILEYGYDMQPLPENRKCIDDWRPVGIGSMGWADMFVAMGIKYGSNEAKSLADIISDTVKYESIVTSLHLAKEKGAFGKFDPDKFMPGVKKFINDKHLLDEISKYGLRNGQLMSLAPSGSISQLVNVSGGLEPLFYTSYLRTTHSKVDAKEYYRVVAKSVDALLRRDGLSWDTISDAEIKEKYPHVVTSYEIKPFDRVDMQSAMQKHTDNAISSTVNLPQNTTVEDVFKLYMYAWKSGCKGQTVYRAGCARESILVSEEVEKEVMEDKAFAYDSVLPISTADLDDDSLHGIKVTKKTACVQKLRCHVYSTPEGDVVEIYTHVSQGCQSNINSLTRMISLAFRSGTKIPIILKQLRKDNCSACIALKKRGQKDVSNSCSHALADAIEKAYRSNKKLKSIVIREEPQALMLCPECGERGLLPEGKCVRCIHCDYSKCD